MTISTASKTWTSKNGPNNENERPIHVCSMRKADNQSTITEWNQIELNGMHEYMLSSTTKQFNLQFIFSAGDTIKCPKKKLLHAL